MTFVNVPKFFGTLLTLKAQHIYSILVTVRPVPCLLVSLPKDLSVFPSHTSPYLQSGGCVQISRILVCKSSVRHPCTTLTSTYPNLAALQQTLLQQMFNVTPRQHLALLSQSPQYSVVSLVSSFEDYKLIPRYSGGTTFETTAFPTIPVLLQLYAPRFWWQLICPVERRSLP